MDGTATMSYGALQARFERIAAGARAGASAAVTCWRCGRANVPASGSLSALGARWLPAGAVTRLSSPLAGPTAELQRASLIGLRGASACGAGAVGGSDRARGRRAGRPVRVTTPPELLDGRRAHGPPRPAAATSRCCPYSSGTTACRRA
jgi:hypothetical protein